MCMRVKWNSRMEKIQQFMLADGVMNEHFSFLHSSITIKGLNKKRHGTRSQDLERGNHADTASYSIA